MLIDKKKDFSYIQKAALFITRNTRPEFKVRLRFLNVDEANNNVPGEDLFNESIVIQSSKQRGWLDFDLTQFGHQSRFNEVHSKIEMHLVSMCDQSVTINNQQIDFKKGESIHTENSHKYTVESFKELAGQAGLTLQNTWQDDQGYFALCLLRPA